jgi:hypothetical protein
MQSSPFSRHFFPLRFKYSPQHPVPKQVHTVHTSIYGVYLWFMWLSSGSRSKVYSHSGDQEILRLLWNPMFHYRVHKSPTLAPTLTQLIPCHTLTPCFFKIHINVIVRSSKWSLPLSFLRLKFCTHVPSQHTDKIIWKVQKRSLFCWVCSQQI